MKFHLTGRKLSRRGVALFAMAAWQAPMAEAQESAPPDLTYAKPKPPLVIMSKPGEISPPFVQEHPAPDYPDPFAAEQKQRQSLEEDRMRRMRFFEAIANADKKTFVAMLNEGMDPNATLPDPVPEDFRKRFRDETLSYYVSRERDFTALMLATCLGRHEFVRFLLMAGADPMRMTQRHKTYALWLAAKYKNIPIMRSLMGIAPEHESNRYRITIDLAMQHAFLWVDGKIHADMPISSGRKSHSTPTGQFLVTDKYRMWTSTLYEARMPYFLRLSCGDFGLHAGALPGYPASHGCIRLPEKAARELFASVPIGTLVEIR